MDKNKVYLVQTDTTVGFLSSNPLKLSLKKQRDPKQKILQTVDSFKTLQKNIRVPLQFRKKIRNSKKTTYIYPNGDSFRVVSQDSSHLNFLQKFHKCYSTSANLTKQEFCEEFAIENADVVVYSPGGFQTKSSSKIFKINKQSIKRIR